MTASQQSPSCSGALLGIGPGGVAVSGREPVGRKVDDRPAVDRLAQKRPLDLDLILVQVDVPAAATATPTVAPRLQQFLGLDRRSLRP